MATKLFLRTRASFDRLQKQIRTLSRVFSFTTQTLFAFYYAYLIYINKDRLTYLIIYLVFLGLTIISFIIEIIYLAKKGDTRLSKRINLENRRRNLFLLRIVKSFVRVGAITLSGIEIALYGSTLTQSITFVLSIVLFVFNLAMTALLQILYKDIDLMRLSLEMDVNNTPILNKFVRFNEDTYSRKEKDLIDDIEEDADKYYQDREDEDDEHVSFISFLKKLKK